MGTYYTCTFFHLTLYDRRLSVLLPLCVIALISLKWVKLLSHVWPFLWPHGLWLARLFYPWNSPGKNTRVSYHSLPQGVFPTQGSYSGLLHCRWILYHLSYSGSPVSLKYCINFHVWMSHFLPSILQVVI